MPDPILGRLDQLSAAFTRLADRAPWVRAAFTVKAGKFGWFGFGPADKDGPDPALLRGLRGDRAQEAAIITELFGLTDQAGLLAMELLQSGSSGNLVSAKSLHCDIKAPWGVWLFILMHLPPTLLHCCTKGPEGPNQLLFTQLGESEVAVWIDSYPQVCVSALACLKTNSLLVAQSNHQQFPSTGKKEKNCSHPDGMEGGRWFWWKNKRYDVPRGTIYRLLDYMWDRDSAGYDLLENAEVFDSTVASSTVRSYANKANNALLPEFPWRLSANSVARVLTKAAPKGHTENPS
jgi:hypothetical protein